ncbi:MAG: glycosyl hydrolase family 28-related protein, partial [Sphingobacteriaceae bacterium]
WSKAIYNVKNYGARGDGLADDTQAITAALEAARKSARSTIYFPEGSYMITKMLTISDNTRWRGDGSDKTSIICGPKFFTNQTMIFGRVKNVEIDQISFDSNSNYKGGGSEHRTEVINLDWSSNIKLKNIKFSFKGYSALRLDNSNEVVIVNCKFIGKKSFLGSCSNLIIDKCDFYLTNDTENALHTWGGKNISMTNSSCRDLDNTNLNDGSGWGKGRFFHAAGNSGSTRHTYLENNRTYDLAVRPVGTDQNSGEQFLWEGFAARWSGQVLSSSHSETTLKGFSKSLTPFKSMAVITKGRGLGQSRWVASASGATIHLESPWNVEPDETSTIAIGHFADKIVMYKNYIDGKAWQVDSENITASSGIQPYGGVHNFIADRNMLTEVRTGIANWATQHAVGIDPNYFNLYTNNTIIHSRWAILNALLEVERPGIGLMGTTYRGNVINNAIESGIAIWLSAVEAPIMESFLYEHNRFSNVPKGFFLRKTAPKSIQTQTFYKNSFKASSPNIAIEVTTDQKTRGNIYTGFSSLYSKTSFNSSVESPFHVIEVTGKSGGTISSAPFTLWNTSTSRLKVKLMTDTKWLNVSEKAVTISSESSSTVTLKANPGKLSQGTHRAYLTVTSGDQSKKYTVIFKVTL